MRLSSIIVCLALSGCSASKPASTPARPAALASTAAAPIKSPPHGQSNWAVFAYVGARGAQVDAAKQALTGKGLEYGVEFFEGELSCNDGAAVALKLPGDSIAISVHFTTEGDAKAFATTLATPPVGIAKVTQMCAD